MREVTSVVYNQECADGMKSLPDSYIDLTVTSPPYDNLRTYNGYTFDWEATLEQLYRVTAAGGVVVWIVADQTEDGSESGTSFRQALYAMECGFKLHDTMIWYKHGVTFPHNKLYHNCFEYMFVFVKGAIKTANLICDKKNVRMENSHWGSWREADGTLRRKIHKPIGEYGRRFNVWQIQPCKSSTERTGHPAQMPIALARDHIISWSNPGDIVLDPFLGSGTTRIAAYDLQRNFIGYEIDAEYFRMQEKRFEQTQQQTRLF